MELSCLFSFFKIMGPPGIEPGNTRCKRVSLPLAYGPYIKDRFGGFLKVMFWKLNLELINYPEITYKFINGYLK
jgi:hypothetical protein